MYKTKKIISYEIGVHGSKQARADLQILCCKQLPNRKNTFVEIKIKGGGGVDQEFKY